MSKYKNWRDLPGFLEAEDKEKIFIKGYLIQAQYEGEELKAQEMAKEILNSALNLCDKKTNPEFILNWLQQAVKLFEAKVRFKE